MDSRLGLTLTRRVVRPLRGSLTLFACLAACEVPAPLPEAPVIHALFDPGAGEVPRPTDLLRDASAGRLAIPTDGDRSPTERAFLEALNQRDGWPSETPAEVRFTGALDPASIRAAALPVYELAPEGTRLVEVEVRVDPPSRPEKLIIGPPAGGWTPGRRYFAAAIGGDRGLRGADGEAVVADAAFYFLRLETPLTEHHRALPGQTEAEQRANAERLEALRLELAPHFAHLARLGVPRGSVAALWSFTVSEATSIVMDAGRGVMPLPSDFLRDPASGLITLPSSSDDSPFEAKMKRVLGDLDGFALSAGLTFTFSAPIAPRTLTSTTVRVFAFPEDGPPREVPLAVFARHRDTAARLELPEGPLAPATDHLVVVTKAVQDSRRRSVVPMLPGVFTLLDAPLWDGERALLPNLSPEQAARLEPVRAKVRRGLAALEGALDPAEVAAAWPFRTMSIAPAMRAARDAAEIAGTPRDPQQVEERSTIRAALDFPLASLTMLRVAKVFEGHIVVPDFLDPLTRARRADGRFEPREVRFVMSIPVGHRERDPLPVAIFGHGLMTERRFVLAIADALAGEGMAAIAIDLPYHGERTHCSWSGPQCLVNPLDTSGPQICPNPCQRGTTCAADGRCVDSAGNGNALATWPVVPFPQASGAAFVDVEGMDGTRDHFYQAITDLSALRRSLREGNWRAAIGFDIDPNLRYVGQSLGGVLGAVFTAVHPDLQRAALNVPGAGVIELFRESRVFAPHLDAYLTREEVERGSPEHERLLDVGRWIMDAIDPASFAPYLLERSFDDDKPLADRRLLIQMATLDVVIPNDSTRLPRLLERLSGVRRVDYLAEHAFLVIPVEPAYLRGTRDVARLLGRGELP